MTILSAAERRLLERIGKTIPPPTFRELAEHIGVSVATVRKRVAALQFRGLVSRQEGVGRSTLLTAKGLAALEEPDSVMMAWFCPGPCSRMLTTCVPYGIQTRCECADCKTAVVLCAEEVAS